jgi:hypothetical protein
MACNNVDDVIQVMATGSRTSTRCVPQAMQNARRTSALNFIWKNFLLCINSTNSQPMNIMAYCCNFDAANRRNHNTPAYNPGKEIVRDMARNQGQSRTHGDV